MGKIILSGFDITKSEKAIVDNIIKTHEIKIEREIEYKALKLTLKKSQHGKEWLYEIKAKLDINNKVFNAEITDYNLFYAVAEALNKIINEAVHYHKE